MRCNNTNTEGLEEQLDAPYRMPLGTKVKLIALSVLAIGGMAYIVSEPYFTGRKEVKEAHQQCQQIDKNNKDEYERIRETAYGRYSCQEIDNRYLNFFGED